MRRIAKSHPAYRWCLEAGWDSEELMSEVMVRVLARQGMPSRYDPARAGVSKYLWTLTGSIMANLSVSRRFLGDSAPLVGASGEPDVTTPDPISALDLVRAALAEHGIWRVADGYVGVRPAILRGLLGPDLDVLSAQWAAQGLLRRHPGQRGRQYVVRVRGVPTRVYAFTVRR